MKKFSTAWKSSTLPRKQRKYRFGSPLHRKQKLVRAHLSKDLRQKYAKRSVQLRKGDTVRLLRGQFKKKEGKVELVDLKRQRIRVAGIEIIKKDGSKVPFAVHPSQLMIIALELGDKKRKEKLEEKIQKNKEKP